MSARRHLEALLKELSAVDNPIKRARTAGELLTHVQQAGVEIGRVRKEAIEQAASGGSSYSDVARQLGLTRGRISQIRSASPPRERSFFGIGPVHVAIPLRRTDERDEPVIASEDDRARQVVTENLSDLALAVDQTEIPGDEAWNPPAGDLVVICGPKSSPTMAEAFENDPAIQFERIGDVWSLVRVKTGERLSSPMDDGSNPRADIAYLGRLRLNNHRSVVVIAGVHALGSIGAAVYIKNHLPELYDDVKNYNFSMVIASRHDQGAEPEVEVLCPPQIH